jgi:hypothetical protein
MRIFQTPGKKPIINRKGVQKMSNSLSIHNVKEINLSQIDGVDETIWRNIEIVTLDGNKFDIALFSRNNDRNDLTVNIKDVKA